MGTPSNSRVPSPEGVGEQGQLELVDQVEPHERPPEADAAPDHDVGVAALPELVDLFCRVTGGDGGVGPVGRLQCPGEDDLRPAFRIGAKAWSVDVVMDPEMPS